MSAKRTSTPLTPLIVVDDNSQKWAHHMNEDPSDTTWFQHHKHFFVYTMAGKPVFSRYGSDIELSTFTATLLAITSVVNDNKDDLRYVRSNNHLYVFLSKGPLQLCCISTTNEPPSLLIKQMEFLYSTICGIIPLPSIQNIFDQSFGADFRTVIGGTFNQMKSSISHGNTSAGLLWDAYDISPMSSSTRNFYIETIQTIVSKCNVDLYKENNDCILFSAILDNSKIIALGKRNNVVLSPMDSQVLIAFVRSITSRQTISWMPLCLSDFNEKSQLHVFVKFISNTTSIVLVSTQPTSLRHLTKCYKSLKHAFKDSKYYAQLSQPTRSESPSLTKGDVLHYMIYNKQENQVITSPYTIHTTRTEQKNLFRIYESMYEGFNNKEYKQQMYVYDNEIVICIENNSHVGFITLNRLQENKQKLLKLANAVLTWAIKDDSLWMKKIAQFS
ncbi:Sand family protein [Entamoeba marina]